MRDEVRDDRIGLVRVLAVELAKVLEVGREALRDRGAARAHLPPTFRASR